MNALQRYEYVTLRLIRRFVFTEHLANRLAGWLPYYAHSVGENEPARIVAEYVRNLAAADLSLDDKRVLEIGAGRTNAVGYRLAGAGAATACMLEPFVAFDLKRDKALRAAMPALTAIESARVSRAQAFDEIAAGSIDLVLSNSVLEHVRPIDAFFADCRRVLAPNGVMLHRVDYRDHFFKYPYGFLTFSATTWARWLNPGDLPRWRLPDHTAALRRAGFVVSVLESCSEPGAFAAIRPRLKPPFDGDDADIAVTSATILAHPA